MADPYPDVVLVSDPLGGGLFAGSLLLPLAAPSLCKQYRITPEYVEYESGVCVCVRTRMLRRSIMYVTLVRSPVSPFLGTRSLVISSMGGNLVIPGLPRETAEEILKDVTPRYPAIRSRIFSSEKGERR